MLPIRNNRWVWHPSVVALGVGLVGGVEAPVGRLTRLPGGAGLDGAIATPPLLDPMISWVIEE